MHSGRGGADGGAPIAREPRESRPRPSKRRIGCRGAPSRAVGVVIVTPHATPDGRLLLSNLTDTTICGRESAAKPTYVHTENLK